MLSLNGEQTTSKQDIFIGTGAALYLYNSCKISRKETGETGVKANRTHLEISLRYFALVQRMSLNIHVKKRYDTYNCYQEQQPYIVKGNKGTLLWQLQVQEHKIQDIALRLEQMYWICFLIIDKGTTPVIITHSISGLFQEICKLRIHSLVMFSFPEHFSTRRATKIHVGVLDSFFM